MFKGSPVHFCTCNMFDSYAINAITAFIDMNRNFEQKAFFMWKKSVET